MTTVLIADDEAVVLKVLARFLDHPDRRLLLASSASEALRLAAALGPVDVALLDKNLGDGSGLDVARELKRRDEHVQVILLTAYASFSSAVEAVQIGAYDYLTKPIEDFDGLSLRIDKAAEAARLAREHRRIVAELAESEARYRQIVDAMPDGLLVFDPVSRAIRSANGAAGRMLGEEPAALAGRDAAALFEGGLPEGAAEVAPVACRRAGGEPFPVEVRHGRIAWHGRAASVMVVRDVSARERLERERRDAEAQLRHAQRLDAVARLAGGIGHDLGNMLAVVLSHAEALDAAHPGIGDVGAIFEAASRAAGLVRQMTSLSRRHAAAGPAALDPAVHEVARLLASALGPRIALDVETGAERILVPLDAGQLGQVLLNLAVNARDAMPDGGRLTVRTAPSAEPGQVTLVVSDTGAGMPEEVRARVFEPFFTTKPEGKGTGLGLAVTRGLVAQAGGRIEVESAPGQGTTFRIQLPVMREAPAPPPQRSVPARAAPRLGRSRTVLVVEDDFTLRAAIARSLAGAGMSVLQAASAEEGLALVRRAGAPDVVVADLVMPGLSGDALALALQEEAPTARVLLVTGSPADPRVAAAAARGVEVLEKPFGERALLERVELLLA